MFHPTLRPLSFPISAALSTVSTLLSPIPALSHALDVAPMHVDLVAEGICEAISEDIGGVVDVAGLKQLVERLRKREEKETEALLKKSTS